jgi:hypothetical protein
MRHPQSESENSIAGRKIVTKGPRSLQTASVSRRSVPERSRAAPAEYCICKDRRMAHIEVRDACMPLTSPSFRRWYDTHAKSPAPPAPKPPFGNLPDLALQSQLGRSSDAAWLWRRGLRGYSDRGCGARQWKNTRKRTRQAADLVGSIWFTRIAIAQALHRHGENVPDGIVRLVSGVGAEIVVARRVGAAFARFFRAS